MGLARRKTSGKIIAGSTLIVPGQDILSAKKFEVTFTNKRGSYSNKSQEQNNNPSTSGTTSN